jgi:hypothetical protein
VYPEMVEKLKGYAEEARKDLGDNLTKREPTNVRKPAVVE